jgi:molecular chaperone GrpE
MYMEDTDDIKIERDGAEEDGMSEVDLEERESSMDAKLKKLRKELDAAKQESKEHLDGWQRAKADYVNALKRFDQEKGDAVKMGSLKAAHGFITVMDTLARAEAHGEVPDSFQAIARQLHDAAHALGLVSFGTLGEAFDPMQHEALGQDAVDSKEKDDTVTAVLETGWKAGDFVMRPAKVRVGAFEA